MTDRGSGASQSPEDSGLFVEPVGDKQYRVWRQGAMRLLEYPHVPVTATRTELGGVVVRARVGVVRYDEYPVPGAETSSQVGGDVEIAIQTGDVGDVELLKLVEGVGALAFLASSLQEQGQKRP